MKDFERISEAYLLHLRNTMKESSYRTARCCLKKYSDFLADRLDRDPFSPVVIDEFASVRREQVTPETVNGTLRSLKAALRWGQKVGLINDIPSFSLLKEGRKRRRILTKTEVFDLIAMCEYTSPDVALAIRLAAFAGLRHQEILHLKTDDIDFVECMIHVTGKEGWVPKNHQERSVPMHAGELRDQLQALVPLYSSSWLFNRRGKRITDLGPTINAVFKTTGLYDPKIKPGLHALRRHWATELLKVTDIRTIKDLGGWESIETVQRYLGVDTEEAKAAIQRL